MRLYVAVREGDFVVTTWSPFGVRVVSVMARSGDFEGSVPAVGSSRRWQQLDRELLSSACVVEVDDEMSIRDLTAAALTAALTAGLVQGPVGQESIFAGARPASGHRTWLADPATDKPFGLDETVRTAGLLDEELVVLCVEGPIEGMYDLLPAADPGQLFAHLQFAGKVKADPPRIHGVLLYTDSDLELATFVRTHFDELNALSGELFKISVLERPQSWRTAKRYWKDRLDPDLYRMLAALQWLKWVPYDKLGAYDVARDLGVPLSDLPCIVLLPRGRQGGRYVFPVRDASTQAFRRLFSDLSETIHGTLPGRSTLERQLDATRDMGFAWLPGTAPPQQEDEPIGDRLARAEMRLRAELVPSVAEPTRRFEFKGATVFIHSGGQAMTENFNFHGQTTFINRPVNTVITDFQNSHGSDTDLAGLLRLVLTSEQLTDEQREQVAQLINEVAGELDTGTPDGGKTRKQLERIKTTVSKAADIATPALTIIAKVLELLP